MPTDQNDPSDASDLIGDSTADSSQRSTDRRGFFRAAVLAGLENLQRAGRALADARTDSLDPSRRPEPPRGAPDEPAGARSLIRRPDDRVARRPTPPGDGDADVRDE